MGDGIHPSCIPTLSRSRRQSAAPPATPAEDALASWAPAAAAPIEAPPVAPYPSSPRFGKAPTRSSLPPGSPSSAGPSYPEGWQPIVSTPSGGRFTRGLRLVGIGFTMARDEPGLMLVPVLAFLFQLVIFGLGALVLWPTVRAMSPLGGPARPSVRRPVAGHGGGRGTGDVRVGGLPRHHHRQGDGPVPRAERDQHPGGPGGPDQGSTAAWPGPSSTTW